GRPGGHGGLGGRGGAPALPDDAGDRGGVRGDAGRGDAARPAAPGRDPQAVGPRDDRREPGVAPASFSPPLEVLPPSGKRARAEANLAAIQTVRAVQAAGRPATPDEQTVLARWSSWGALPEVFEGWREEWADVQAQVRQTLTGAEFDAAAATT